MGLLLVQAIGNLYLPDLNGDIINNGVVNGDIDYILRVGGADAPDHGPRRRRGDRQRLPQRRASRWASGATSGRAVFSAVETFGQVEVNQFGPASLITRNTNDVQQVQQVVFMALTIMVSAPILIVGGIFMALRTDVPLSGLLLVVIPLMALVIGARDVAGRSRSSGRPRSKLDRINQVMRETLAGVRVIRAFVRTRHEEARFDDGEPRPVRHPAPGRPPVRPRPSR